MKKLSLLAIAAVLVAVSFSSCKKCITCSIGGVEGSEVCGKKSERTAYETTCKNAGGTVKTK